jgi:CheY-like chemotaxis protein
MFSRRQAARIETLDLNALVHDLLKLLGRLLGENIIIVPRVCPDAFWVRADAGMMEQVVMNLCINARDAMPQGGKLTLATTLADVQAQGEMPHAEARSGRFVCLSVTDTGCGMDDAVLGRMFEPFFTTKEVGKGTGLGLATAYGIVKQHQGWIEVESRVGKGSTFRVYLPEAKQAGVLVGGGHEDEIKGGTEMILVVEDEVYVRRLVANCLRKLGYAVLEAGDAQDALRVWREHHERISLLFTDTLMPGILTGLDLARQLRQEKSGLKIISSSGYRAELTESPALTGGKITYLPKPYAPALLAKAVRRCLDEA